MGAKRSSRTQDWLPRFSMTNMLLSSAFSSATEAVMY